MFSVFAVVGWLITSFTGEQMASVKSFSVPPATKSPPLIVISGVVSVLGLVVGSFRMRLVGARGTDVVELFNELLSS